MTGVLAGRVALVTGASSGIGEGAALALAANGAHVVLAARRADRLAAVAKSIEAAGGSTIALPADLTDEAAATRVVADTIKHFGRLDILVNAAGVMRDGGVENADFARWRQALDINLLASVYTSRAAIPQMRAQGAGDILNISSTAGRRASGAMGIYSTTKFALTAMTEGMRQEVGGYGIRVCLLEPGATGTEIAQGVGNPEIRKIVHERGHRDGAMKPEDIAAAILFVVSLPARVNVSEMLIRPTSDTAPL